MKNVVFGVISGGVGALAASAIVGLIKPEQLLTRALLVGVLTAVIAFLLLMYVFKVGKTSPPEQG